MLCSLRAAVITPTLLLSVGGRQRSVPLSKPIIIGLLRSRSRPGTRMNSLCRSKLQRLNPAPKTTQFYGDEAGHVL
jgi:hypothetical protein